MEEDINYLKSLLDLSKLLLLTSNKARIQEREIEAIENMLNELERLKNKKYLMSISCDRNCQICEHVKNEFLLKTENRHLKKGINTLMSKRKKWKDRYYKLKTENSNISRELLHRTDELNKLLKENEKLKIENREIKIQNLNTTRELLARMNNLKNDSISKQAIRELIEKITE